MDLIGYDQEKFNAIQAEILQLAGELGLESVKIIPVSATEGDNVTKKSDNIPWYTGEPILTYLEEVDVTERQKSRDLYAGTARVPSEPYFPWFPGTDRGRRGACG